MLGAALHIPASLITQFFSMRTPITTSILTILYQRRYTRTRPSKGHWAIEFLDLLNLTALAKG
ncbi:hypothetical protein BJX63DRAFT_384341 [Aspergillus granulosus]|uniref:Uncharacterized protein n=1 Tax=Aspergillus granulosus TaxID=176169 RepID=A0ABR4HRA9_9EURO